MTNYIFDLCKTCRLQNTYKCEECEEESFYKDDPINYATMSFSLKESLFDFYERLGLTRQHHSLRTLIAAWCSKDASRLLHQMIATEKPEILKHYKGKVGFNKWDRLHFYLLSKIEFTLRKSFIK